MEMFIHLMERHLIRNFKNSEKNITMILCQAVRLENTVLINYNSPAV